MADKILITGGCGFIGSHLVEHMVLNGYEVVVYDRYNSESNYGWLEESQVKKDVKIILGDIRDFDSVYNAVNQVDSIIHLAALIGIPYSYESPLAYLKTNTEGTYNILESAKKLNSSNITITSTSEVYGSAKYSPIDEDHPLQAQSPYSASKISADHLAFSYFNSYNLPIKVLRPFNTYGPRQSKRAIIPTIISQFLNDSDTVKLGSLDPIRDFTYVSDTCNGFEKIYKEQKAIGKVFNLGSNNEISINEVVKLVSKLTKITKKIDIDNSRVRPEKSEVNHLNCDYTKFNNLVKWEPTIKFENGLLKTIDWISCRKNYLNSNDYKI